jgi:hypothetical protein
MVISFNQRNQWNVLRHPAFPLLKGVSAAQQFSTLRPFTRTRKGTAPSARKEASFSPAWNLWMQAFLPIFSRDGL